MLLDKSHLELVEDILKETNFNNKDWEQLGRELRVYYWSGNSLNLKECLRKWLSRNSFYDDLPTLYDLAAALKRIGYSEAGEYIIQTCKLIIMFNDQCY